MDGFVMSGPSQFGMLFIVLTIIVLLAGWVILAASRFTEGGIVERPERVRSCR